MFDSKITDYFPDSSDFSWLVVSNNGICVYAFVSSTLDSEGLIGSYGSNRKTDAKFELSYDEFHTIVDYFEHFKFLKSKFEIKEEPETEPPTEKATEKPTEPPVKNKIPESYQNLDYINNAPDDMEFYDNIGIGYIATESTGLNMRQGAGKDYKVITEIPKGAEVRIIGQNSEWCYVNYFNSYGYVSRQYISASALVVEKVEVYPCDYLGIINTDGLGVIGFATSYVVDGGKPEEICHRLGDWHVKAVNWCYSKDILWYELYDSEDGDYYGWVDSEYIEFY